MKTLLLLLVPAVAFATTSEGRLTTRQHGETLDVPLEHTDVRIHVVGQLAEVAVEQRFHNPYDKKIDAVYLFPLPTGAAVHRLELVSGGRVIHGSIAPREEARRKYIAAQQKGKIASLLTEERPNLFTQQVANLEPDARVVVRIHYVQSLEYDDGGYEIVFPMVAGPRYVPKSSDAVVQPAVLPPGVRSSHDIALAADVEPAPASLESPSHHLVGNGAHVELAPGDTIPNKDFVLRWRVAGAEPSFALLAHNDGEGSFFLMAQPPAHPRDEDIAPREVIFVVDTSSSMAGRPLAKARELVRRTLASLRRDDTFQIVRFGDDGAALGPKMLAPKTRNIDFALAWLEALPAAGGTEMMAGLHTALSLPHDPARLRLVVLLTDGYLGNEDEVLAAAAREVGAARLFCFGVGSAVNRWLLEELAQLGHGAAAFVRPDEDTGPAVTRFQARIDRPLLTDVRIDWGGLAVRDVTPARDLFAGQPLILSGHYDGSGSAAVTVHGRQAGRDVAFTVPVTLPLHDVSRPQVPLVWARARIAELERRLLRGADVAGEIRALALRHGIMTRYTAFVAVDESSHTSGKSRTVNVPVEVPEGLGNLAHGGYGAGGVGYGYGGLAGGSYSGASYGMVAHKVAAPAVVEAQATVVRGSLDREIIRRVVHRRTNEVRFCYEKELQLHPRLAGRVVVHFLVSPDGKVANASITSSTLANADVETCVAGAVRKWEWPAVEGGGVVEVSYPFVFQPGDTQ